MTAARCLRSARVAAWTLAACAGLGLLACEGSRSSAPRTKAKAPEVVSADPRPDSAPTPTPAPAPAPTPEVVKPRPILGKRTTEVRDAQAETKGNGAVATTPRITAKDPITLAGNAYVTAIGQTSILQIQHALDLYQAETGEFPKTYDEFKAKILQANNIALPTLPYYQEYGYDAPTHKLLILEYPDRKAAANDPRR